MNYNATPALVSNALSSAQGVWPTQFALQSAFYLNEANLNKGTSSKHLGYLSDAYTTAMLSSSLDRVDAVLKSNFVQAPSATSAVPSSVAQQLAQIYLQLNFVATMLVVIVILLMIVFVILVSLMIENRKLHLKSRRRR